MKHATQEALRKVARVLVELRKLPGVKEKKQGIFYRGRAAFVHFHEDSAGTFADVRTKNGWRRLAVNSAADVKVLLREVNKALKQVSDENRRNAADHGGGG